MLRGVVSRVPARSVVVSGGVWCQGVVDDFL